MRANKGDSVQDAFREGFFWKKNRLTNPYRFGSLLWEAWTVGKHFRDTGLGYFNIKRHYQSSYIVEDGRIVSILYSGNSQFRIGMEESLFKQHKRPANI